MFETTVPGKWILSGEHSVIKGCLAVALAHPEFSLTLTFCPGGKNSGPSEIFKLLKPYDSIPTGNFKIKSTIPQGAGLGSSAALCVAVARFLASQKKIPLDEIIKVATRLEDNFHGESSGLDVSICESLLSGAATYSKESGLRKIESDWNPRFRFINTGLIGNTREMVERVKAMSEADSLSPMDVKMNRASQLAQAAFFKKNQLLLEESMRISMEVFKEWGIVPEPVQRLEENLYNEGAKAVRLTGAGGGGYLVALAR